MIGLIMFLWLAIVNARALGSEARRASLCRDIQRLGVYIRGVQETRFPSRKYESILSRGFPCLQHVLMDDGELSHG